ncbi:MAG: riboflavin synthase [Gemmatimonadales bacterium]|nr:MAG: riboflavin synthase [Gemmatimonadales bacterium]
MFTGIVETTGTVLEVQDLPGLRKLRVEAEPDFLRGVQPGASVAVDGACLTPVAVEGDRFQVELVLSTLDRTVAAGYTTGSRVNLERAMRVDARLDGHVVQGHVDGVGELLAVRQEGDTRFLDFRIPPEVWDLTILHGSIALNGISLTVNDLNPPDRVQVAIIPHTWAETNLSELEPGDPVNVEGDLMGKYVQKILAPRAAAKHGGV